MRITLLGTGSPESHPKRASSGYLIETGDDRILFDCGGGVVSRLIESGREPTDITHLFFTHLHSDHMMDYARLVHAAWDEGGAPLQVWGPPPIAEITEKLFGRDGVFATDLTARTEHPGSQEVWRARGGSLPRPWPSPIVTEVEPGFSHRGDDWVLTSCPAPHVQPYLTCMAFRIETPRAAFVFSGDADRSADVERLAEGADLLVHWCYRLETDTADPWIAEHCMTPADIAAMAARADVKRLLLTHFRVHMDTEAAHEAVHRQLKANFPREAGIAEDLMEIALG